MRPRSACAPHHPARLGARRRVRPQRGDEDLDITVPVVVEGVLRGIRHPARGQFPAVVELQVNFVHRVADGLWPGTGPESVRKFMFQWMFLGSEARRVR